ETLAEPQRWTFESARPTLVRSIPHQGEAHAQPGGDVRLHFDQAIREDRASDFIEVRADRGAIPVRVRADGDSVLVVRPDGGVQRATAYVVRILPGLPAAAGPLGTANTTTLRF